MKMQLIFELLQYSRWLFKPLLVPFRLEATKSLADITNKLLDSECNSQTLKIAAVVILSALNEIIIFSTHVWSMYNLNTVNRSILDMPKSGYHVPTTLQPRFQCHFSKILLTQPEAKCYSVIGQANKRLKDSR